MEFFTKNVDRLDKEEFLSLLTGFEISFPGLLDEAKLLGVDLPYDAPFFQVMEETRQEKLRRYSLVRQATDFLFTDSIHSCEPVTSGGFRFV